MFVSEIENYRDLILENIEYDYLCREFSSYREDLDAYVVQLDLPELKELVSLLRRSSNNLNQLT